MLNIALLGSTGSIGTQVADVVRRHGDEFKIISVTGNSNARVFLRQVEEFKPKIACFEELIDIPDELKKHTEFFLGKGSYRYAITECDVLFVALSGFVGFSAVLSGIKKVKKIALANKESLVVGGEILTRLARQNGVELIPVDSEHSAVFQALGFNKERPFERIILTASGGAFRNFSEKELKTVTPKEALNHPNWKMGKKVTIDSATLMNKGFEVIEAKWLYDTDFDKIDVVIHEESIIHSMVEFADGSVIAQLAYPTMEIPIQLALTYPNRLKTAAPRLDFASLKALHFDKIDNKRFPCFDLAVSCGKEGGLYPAAMNAADEVAVDAFLKGEIAFTDIYKVVDGVLNRTKQGVVTEESLLLIDKRSRMVAREIIGK